MKKSNIFLLVVILVILLLGVGLVLINNTNNHNNNNNLTGNVISINNPEILNPNNNSINSLLGTFWTTYPGSSQNDIARFKAIGGSWVKPIFYWRAYETTKDHYNVTYLKQFDAVISANQNAGLENTIVIDGGNVPGWQDCINYKHYLCDNCRKDPIYGGNCTDQEFNGAVEQFSKLAQEVVKHYSVSPYNITTFQIMIEPNTGEKYKVDFVYPEKFAEIIANVYPKIKEICNGCIVYTGGEAMIDPSVLNKAGGKNATWLYKMFTASKNKYGKAFGDWVAVHAFGSQFYGPETNQSGLLTIYQTYKEIGEEFNISYNGKTQVIADEFESYTSCTGNGKSAWPSSPSGAEQAQANNWARSILLTLSTSYVPKIAWAIFIDDNKTISCSALSTGWENSGAYFSNRVIKKSGMVVGNLTNILMNYTFESTITSENNTYVLKFNKRNNKLLAAWTTNGQKIINLNNILGNNYVTIYYLNNTSKTSSSSAISISEEPIFIEQFVPSNCTSFTYSTWGTCTNGTQSRAILTSSPLGCIGGNPILIQNCTVPLPTIIISASTKAGSFGATSPVTFIWNSTNAKSCFYLIDGVKSQESISTSGSKTVTLTKTITVTLNCTNSVGNSTSKSLEIKF